MKCTRCGVLAQTDLPWRNAAFCPDCYFEFFSRQVRKAIKDRRMFGPDDRILVALSGGKDSLSLMCELKRLGYDVTGLHLDLGIGESSVQSRAAVAGFCEAHGLPWRVVELASDGLAIPAVKKAVKRRPVCSACGKIKRYWLNRYAFERGFDVLATGHNLDDEAARLLANSLRWDQAYLAAQGPEMEGGDHFVRKVKPLYRLTEQETACYAFLRGVECVTAPCPYSGKASFTVYKRLLYDLEYARPGAKFQFYEAFLKRGRPAFQAARPDPGDLRCADCGAPTREIDNIPEAERGRDPLCGVCRLRRMAAAGE